MTSSYSHQRRLARLCDSLDQQHDQRASRRCRRLAGKLGSRIVKMRGSQHLNGCQILLVSRFNNVECTYESWDECEASLRADLYGEPENAAIDSR